MLINSREEPPKSPGGAGLPHANFFDAGTKKNINFSPLYDIGEKYYTGENNDRKQRSETEFISGIFTIKRFQEGTRSITRISNSTDNNNHGNNERIYRAESNGRFCQKESQ